MENTDPKELNLVQIINVVFKWIYDLIRKIVIFTGRLLQISVKHWIVFLLCLALGIVGAIYFAQDSKQTYMAETTLYVSNSNSHIVKDIIDKLKVSPMNNKELSLASKLNIPDSVTSEIVAIKYFNIIDYIKDDMPDLVDFKNQHSLSDTMNVVLSDRIYLQIETRNPNQIATLEKALLDYINANPRLIREFEARRKGYEARVEFAKAEIKRIDSLANISYFQDLNNKSLNLNNNSLIVGEQKKPLIYEDVISLIGTKETNERFLNIAKTPVFLTDGFSIYGPVNSKMKIFIYGLLIGIAAGLLASYIFEQRKSIINFLKNK